MLDAILNVMDSVTFPVLVLSEDAIYIHENPAAAESLGYRHDEIEGRYLTDILEADHEWVLRGFERLKTTAHFSGPVLYRMKRGGLYRGNANVFMRTLRDGSRVAVSMVMPVGYGSGESEVIQTVDAFGLMGEEVRLLQLISVGLSNQQMLEVLSVSADDLSDALHALFAKMNVESKTQAAIMALKAKVVL